MPTTIIAARGRVGQTWGGVAWGLCLLLLRFVATLARLRTRRLSSRCHGVVIGLLGHVFYRRVRDALNQSLDGAFNRLVEVRINLSAHAIHFFADRRCHGALYRALRSPVDPWIGFPLFCERDGRRTNGLVRVGGLRVNRDYQ